MDMKLAELQIALPKTYEAGNMQNVLHQHPQMVQSQLAEATKRQDDAGAEASNRKADERQYRPQATWRQYASV
jgi:hypothetical protein